ncbi:MAG TPA: RdgB/HAM1 family non-canonical purine NTP pyrophosphatase [Actinomycetota bacterium]|nr:RdgB/HAM1 family non-canonical purine NTP pyrophosphatase [Actinomycetota bacterium]
MKVVLATSNPGKVREVRAILEQSPLDAEVVAMWIGHEETGESFLENARLKAAAAVRLTGRPCLTEDAGLEVDGLNGLPGVHSARFAGPSATDDDNTSKLLRLAAQLPEERLTARYRAAAVLLLPSGAEVVGEGSWAGRIILEPRGTGGFGYDPVFVPVGETQTAAELDPSTKNRASHRAQALTALLAQLASHAGSL